jgi:hypothetical protein
MREDIQYQAYQRRLQENTKKNNNHTIFTLEENQLILIRSSPKERQWAATTHGQASKLVPRWSLPYRVLHVYPGGQRALVRNLITRHTRDAHITDIRLIEKPADEAQRTLWEQELQEKMTSMFEFKEREKVLRDFWEEIDYPQRTMAL